MYFTSQSNSWLLTTAHVKVRLRATLTALPQPSEKDR